MIGIHKFTFMLDHLTLRVLQEVFKGRVKDKHINDHGNVYIIAKSWKWLVTLDTL